MRPEVELSPMDAIPNPADRIRQFDPEMAALLDSEQERQQRTLSPIPSENALNSAIKWDWS